MNMFTRRPTAVPKRAAGPFSLALSLLLVFQSFAFLSPASAQRRLTAPPPKPAPVVIPRPGRTVGPPAQGGGKTITPQQRPITTSGPVYMKHLEAQNALGPQQFAPRQLKPIHPPKPVPRRKAAGVITPSATQLGPTKLSPQPAAPVSSGVQSPPPSRAFRSDLISLGSVPPDTMGAVGPNHVVTTTNEKVIVYDRKGAVLSNVTLDAFWASLLLGGSPPSTFDPKILYDRFNDRFILVTQANSVSPTSATLIAVSQTGDPTAAWNRYAIDADAGAVATSGNWADYPSIGFNKNWIVVQVNLFSYAGSPAATTGYAGPAVYVLDKGAAYANTPSTVSTFEGSFDNCITNPTTQTTNLGCGSSMVPVTTEDNTTETEYIVEEWSATDAQLRISKVTGTPSSPVLTIGTQFPQSPNSWHFVAENIGATFGYVPQRAFNSISAGISPFRVAANDSRMQAAVLRNGSLWAVHHVMLPTVPTAAGVPASTLANPDNHVAVQWWEIDPTVEPTTPIDPVTNQGTTPTQRGRIEDPTSDNCHNGVGGLRAACVVQGQNFSFPSIAVNQNEDVLIGYSRFSETTLPKAAYSFRAGSDSANTMRDSQTFREGLTDYALTNPNRWGDYSATVVDPTNDTDFWTIQEVAEGLKQLLLPGNTSFFTTWGTWWAQIKPSSTTTTAGNLIISEFRLRGPGNLSDEFIELYNPSSSPLTVTTTDGSDGWALVHSTASATPTITVLASIPNGTTIPARGHYLIVNHTHDLISPIKNYPNTQPPGTPAAQVVRPSDADAAYNVDLETVGGIAIFRTSNPANFATTRMDSVGFQSLCTANPASIYKEGTCIANIDSVSGTSGEFSFNRVQAGASLTSPGAPQDTQNNAADFLFISTNHTQAIGSTTPPRLGAPGPQNLSSPLGGLSIGVDRLDVNYPISSPPNRVRKLCSDPTVEECNANRSALGTISMRRRVTNYTGADVSRLRWRITLTSTAPAPAGTADLRAITSSDITVNGQPVKGTTLEEPPTQTTRGGGWNASWSAALPTPLAPGATISVQFLFGVQQGGTFGVLVQTEALP